MRGKVDSFRGALTFKVGDKFIKAPLKSLGASGIIEMSDIVVGEQKVESASGEVSLSGGKVTIVGATIKENRSVLYVSGKFGAGEETNIRIYGHAALSDLKILNLFLPQDIVNPVGSADLDLQAFGRLNRLDSADDLLKLGLSGKIRVSETDFGGVKIQYASLEASVSNRVLNISDLQLKTGNSLISGRYLTPGGDDRHGAVRPLRPGRFCPGPETSGDGARGGDGRAFAHGGPETSSGESFRFAQGL